MDLGFSYRRLHLGPSRNRAGPTVGRVAVAAEAAGAGRLTVEDHLWQVAAFGELEEPMLEAYTTLGYLAAVTQRVRLHTLVTRVVYRDPGLLAKMISPRHFGIRLVSTRWRSQPRSCRGRLLPTGASHGWLDSDPIIGKAQCASVGDRSTMADRR
jgi:hypothetical protein